MRENRQAGPSNVAETPLSRLGPQGFSAWMEQIADPNAGPRHLAHYLSEHTGRASTSSTGRARSVSVFKLLLILVAQVRSGFVLNVLFRVGAADDAIRRVHLERAAESSGIARHRALWRGSPPTFALRQ